MRDLVRYFVRYPVAGNVLMLLIFIFGYFGLTGLKSTFFPQSESRIINVNAVYPGASPEEIEEGVILKIEDNLKGVTGIYEVTSVSSENVGTITVEVEKGQDIDLMVQDVKNAVDQINSFPTGLEPITVVKRESRNFVMNFAISGDVELKELKQFGQKVEDDLRAKDGISKITLAGFPDEEVQIAFDEQKLQAYSLTIQQAVAAVQKNNLESTGGKIKGNEEEYLIRARSKKYYAEDLEDIVVKATEDGQIVRLGDVANLTNTWADSPNRSWFDKAPSVTVTIQNTNDEDFLSIVDKVKEYITEFNERNDVVQIDIIRDSSITLNERIDLLTENGLIGFVLVLLVLAVFLNLKLSFWVALSIPISFAGMFIVANPADLTINVLSLFGMILVVGILVDDGIVIGENIYQHFERGAKPLKAAVEGTMEVIPAVFSAVATTVVAFSTFYFLDGNLGDFGPDLAFVVIFSLVFSLVEGLLILPSHIAYSLNSDGKKNKLEQKTTQMMEWLKSKLYGPALRWSIRYQFIALMIPIALFMITIGGIAGGFIELTFFPFIERNDIAASVELPSGSRDYRTKEVLNEIEEAALRVNERLKAQHPQNKDVIENVEVVLGPKINEGKVNMLLLSSEERTLRSFQIADTLRREVGQIPEAEKLAFGGAGVFGKPVSIAMRSNNLSEMEAAKTELKSALGSLSSVTDITDTDQRGVKEIVITPKEKAYLLGLTLADIFGQIRGAFFGTEAQRLQRGEDEVKIWVRFDDANRASIEDLNNFRIRLQNGREIPLEELVDYEMRSGVISIQHFNGQRSIRIEGDLSNPDESVSAIQAEIAENIIPPLREKYSSINFSFEGQNKQAAKTGKSFGKVGPIILILMIAIVTFVFRSLPQAIVIFIIIPLGLIGVGWGHFIHGHAISLLSAFGVIALIGVMVNDSLVFVTAMNINLKRGMDFLDAVYEAGLSRFRPILLTSFTTIAGLAPLIAEKSFQAQFLVPMAIAVAYGLLIATYTTLFVLPVMLVTVNSIRVNINHLWTGRRPTRKEVEPAVVELKAENEEF